MLTRLRHLLRPPVFADEDQTHQAFLLHIILLALMLMPLPYVVYYLLFAPEAAGPPLAQTAFGEFVNIVLFFLLRRGRVRLAATIQVILFWGLFTLIAVTGAGVRGPAYLLGYGLVIVVAGVLLGGRGVLAGTVLSLVSGGLMAWAEGAGRLVPSQADSSLTLWIISLAVFPLGAVLQYLASTTVQQSLARA